MKQRGRRDIAVKRQYCDVYRWGKERLQQAGLAEAELDARLLLEAVCRTDRNTLLVHGDRAVSGEEYENYVNYIFRRESRVPLQYIIGTQEFMGLEFYVNQNVLIPRQDTEILVEEALQHLHDGMRILDMCTGSGCILLSLLYYSNDCAGLGVDISEQALQVAKRNADKLQERKQKEQGCRLQVDFLQSDLFEQLAGKRGQGFLEPFEMMVSNPPYIRHDAIDALMPEIKGHEPLLALDGKEDGLFFYRRIVSLAGLYLSGGGELFLEIGCEQGRAVKDMMEAAGFDQVKIIKDYAGLDRVVRGIWIA